MAPSATADCPVLTQCEMALRRGGRNSLAPVGPPRQAVADHLRHLQVGAQLDKAELLEEAQVPRQIGGVVGDDDLVARLQLRGRLGPARIRVRRRLWGMREMGERLSPLSAENFSR